MISDFVRFCYFSSSPSPNPMHSARRLHYRSCIQCVRNNDYSNAAGALFVQRAINSRNKIVRYFLIARCKGRTSTFKLIARRFEYKIYRTPWNFFNFDKFRRKLSSLPCPVFEYKSTFKKIHPWTKKYILYSLKRVWVDFCRIFFHKVTNIAGFSFPMLAIFSFRCEE